MSEARQPAPRERLPDRREHVVVNVTTADGFRYTGGLGYFDDGRLAATSPNAEKTGAAIKSGAAGPKQ
jgi:hypothetical protein